MCVICREETEEDKDLHIDLRDYYVDGAGPCCRECYVLIYGIDPAAALKFK